MPDRTPHQDKIIKRYYEHRDEILVARLQEIVSELYLADSEAQRRRLWSRAAKAMSGLKVPERLSSHILAQREPELLARHLKEWLGRSPT